MIIKELKAKLDDVRAVGIEVNLPKISTIFIKNPETGLQFAIEISPEGQAAQGSATLADFADFEVVKVQANPDNTASAVLVHGWIFPIYKLDKEIN